jgi:hypothetical protein
MQSSKRPVEPYVLPLDDDEKTAYQQLRIVKQAANAYQESNHAFHASVRARRHVSHRHGPARHIPIFSLEYLHHEIRCK